MNKSNISRIGPKEKEYLLEVLKTEFRSSKGCNMMGRFESAFAKRFGMKYAISHVNGTATLHTAIEAANIGRGDEVIVPPLTMSSTSFAVLHANATPIFADVDPDTFQISPKSIKERITPRTKAVMTVSLYGLSPDLDPIIQICKKNNLILIEDNAECFLGKYKGKLVGTFGDMASFSFQSSKHLTAGEGGVLVTNSKELANNIRRFQSLGYSAVGASEGKITKKDIQDPNYSRHVSLGWNYRMSELCAAVALGQIENIDILVQRRMDVAQEFDNIVRNCDWLVAQKVHEECIHSYWTYVVKLEHEKITWHEFRDKFLELGGDGIYAAWKLTYKEPMFQNYMFLGRENLMKENLQDYKSRLCPNAEDIQPKLLQLRTNYWEWDRAEKNFEILKKTIAFFDGM